eukprot:TRINITY_DN41312_c0_g1_i1.p1 TRINITY_DN41312_c0_g1~~TRINITY_DN41312_c0_g1_i1.p1  ORF type:complete len:500 (+),score=129.77 TRINITY_DN41312_c0_g1_i1:57-1502(+)
MSFDALDVDSLLLTLSSLNVQSLARVACSSRLGAVAAHEAQQKPSLLVLKGRPDAVGKALREKLASTPTLAFLQYGQGDDGDRGQDMLDWLRKRLPGTTTVLGAQTDSVQCAVFPDDRPMKQGTDLLVDNYRGNREDIAVLLATLPEANAHTFHLLKNKSYRYDDSEDDDEDFEEEEDDDESSPAEEAVASPAESPAQVGPSLVEAAPQKAAGAGYAAAAAAVEQNASWLSSLVGQPSTEQVAEAATEKKEEEASDAQTLAALMALKPAPQVIVMHYACGPSPKLLEKIQTKFPNCALIGGVVMGGEVVMRQGGKGRGGGRSSVGQGVGLLAITGNAPLFAMTSPFQGNVKHAISDVQKKMARAKELALAEERKILGALLITCNGRGLRMFGKDASDARLFQEQFPHAQLLGYYAGGEIGPEVEDGKEEHSSFMKGNAAFQGFTAVYGFFLVPSKHAPSLQFVQAVLHGDVKDAFDQLRKT